MGSLFTPFTGTGNWQDNKGSQFSQTNIKPEDLAAIRAAQGGLAGRTSSYQQTLDRLTAESGKAGAPSLTTGNVPIREVTPTFSTQPDAVARQQAALGQQALAQQASAQRQAIASQFRGQPGVSSALQRQADIQTRLQGNPMLAQALQMQQGRELGQQQLGLSAAQAANEARMAQRQGSNQALLQQQQAGIASRAEQAGYGGAGLQAGQSLLQGQLATGEALGQKYQTQTGATQGRSGGIFTAK